MADLRTFIVTMTDHTVKRVQAHNYTQAGGFTTFLRKRSDTVPGAGSDKVATYPDKQIHSIELDGEVETTPPAPPSVG